jgi:hypothetical protein
MLVGRCHKTTSGSSVNRCTAIIAYAARVRGERRAQDARGWALGMRQPRRGGK